MCKKYINILVRYGNDNNEKMFYFRAAFYFIGRIYYPVFDFLDAYIVQC